MNTQLLFFDELKNTSLRFYDNDKAGSIDDIALELESGQVVFYTAASGGFLGMGEDKLALPPNTLHFKEDDVQLAIEEERLRDAPGQGDRWPERIDSQFLDSLYSHYGYRPANPL